MALGNGKHYHSKHIASDNVMLRCLSWTRHLRTNVALQKDAMSYPLELIH
jgi:hypothetical protein